jgi:hypothetical protein
VNTNGLADGDAEACNEPTGRSIVSPVTTWRLL